MRKDNVKKAINKRPQTKKQLEKKLKKECEIMWSRIVRSKNNGMCCLCNKNKAQAAHHWYINRARSKHAQFKELNGLPLCYGCHIHIIHKDASVANSIKLLERARIIFNVEDKQLIMKLKELNYGTGKPYCFEDLCKDHDELTKRCLELGL